MYLMWSLHRASKYIKDRNEYLSVKPKDSESETVCLKFIIVEFDKFKMLMICVAVCKKTATVNMRFVECIC